MATDDLRQLEREVEAARARLTGDIAALRSPGALSEFTRNLKQTAFETRDTLIDDAKSRTRSAVEEMVETVKEKAIANPAAALVIGAGVAWHLVRRPPVAAALIGGGLFSLLRTQAAPTQARGNGDDLARARENLKGQAENLAAAASGLGETAKGHVATTVDKARAAVSRLPIVGVHDDTNLQAGNAEAEMSGEEADPDAANGRHRLTEMLTTDKLLLGAAGVAVAAAIAAVYQRRHAEMTD